jgi:hypothetical protein
MQLPASFAPRLMLSLDVQYAVHDWNDMEDKRSENYDREYQERFEWRKSRWVSNLKELSQVAHAGGADAIKAFPGLHCSLTSDDP